MPAAAPDQYELPLPAPVKQDRTRRAGIPSHHKRTVYLSTKEVLFQTKPVGEQSMTKIFVCNRESVTLKFEVIKPKEPFSIVHSVFTLR